MFEVVSRLGGVEVPAHVNSSSGIALDNIRHTIVTNRNQCKTKPANSVPPTPPAPVTSATTAAPAVMGFNCNFEPAGDTVAQEGSLCGWTQRPQDKYKWLLGKSGDTGNVWGPVNGDYSPNRGTSTWNSVLTETGTLHRVR